MAISVDIVSEAEGWDTALLARAAQAGYAATMSELGLEAGAWEVSLLACDNARIADLNRDFRGKALPTNVLSWPSAERGAVRAGDTPRLPDPANPMDAELGDIAIALETCQHEARSAEKPFEQHVTHLLVHALLHLLGYDHENDQDAALMEGLEVTILATLGHPDPYIEHKEA